MRAYVYHWLDTVSKRYVMQQESLLFSLSPRQWHVPTLRMHEFSRQLLFILILPCLRPLLLLLSTCQHTRLSKDAFYSRLVRNIFDSCANVGIVTIRIYFYPWDLHGMQYDIWRKNEMRVWSLRFFERKSAVFRKYHMYNCALYRFNQYKNL